MKRVLFVFLILLSFVGVSPAQVFPSIYRGGDFRIPIPARFRREITMLYRKTNRKEAEAVKPAAEDVKKYADFLRRPGTGLTRIVNDAGCADNRKVVVVKPECLKYTMPGAGASFSFRVNDYRIPSLADLTFSDNGFQATGVLLHGILTRIGDVSLETVSAQTAGVEFLTDFQPVTDFDAAKKIGEELVEGIEKDGFIYRRGLNALENTTYVLRSIAYDGEYPRAFNGFTYNELDFDRRRDVLVAFRIVRRDADGSVTILWKQLAERDAPKLKQKKK